MQLTHFKDPWKSFRTSVCISNGYIGEIDEPCSYKDAVDCKNYTLLPGLIDLQVYGAGGYIFEEDISLSCIRKISDILLRHGTTGFLITLPSTYPEKIFKAMK